MVTDRPGGQEDRCRQTDQVVRRTDGDRPGGQEDRW